MLNRLLLYSPELLHASQLPLLLHLHVVHGMHYLICKFVLVGGQAGGKRRGDKENGRRGKGWVSRDKFASSYIQNEGNTILGVIHSIDCKEGRGKGYPYMYIHLFCLPVYRRPSAYQSTCLPVYRRPSAYQSTCLPVYHHSSAYQSTCLSVYHCPSVYQSTCMSVYHRPSVSQSTCLPVYSPDVYLLAGGDSVDLLSLERQEKSG